MNRMIATLFLLISVLLGFLIFSPMVPHQFQQAIIGAGPGPGGPSLVIVSGLIILFLVLTFAAGRIFCAQICPIGAVQELFYTDPKQKFLATEKVYLMVLRGIVIILFFAMGIFFSIALLDFFGIREFFSLEIESMFFTAFVVLIAISLFFYRPFCRLICPVGALFSLAAAKGLYKLRRTDACTQCGTCERACPTGEAGAGDNKMECYLCGRCIRACPQDGALAYNRADSPLDKGAK
jgi:polyferredoxin